MLKICWMVLLHGLNPACSSERISSALLLSLFTIILSNTFLAWRIRLMVPWLWHCLGFPFLRMGIIKDLVHVCAPRVAIKEWVLAIFPQAPSLPQMKDEKASFWFFSIWFWLLTHYNTPHYIDH